MASSPIFRAMFDAYSFSQLKQKPIDLGLAGILSFEVLEAVIDFAGSGKLKMTHENVTELIRAADFFKMDKLKHHMGMAIMRDTRKQIVDCKNVLPLWNLSRLHDAIGIRAALERYIQEHFETIMYEASFPKLDLEEILEILGWDSLNISSEKHAFYAIRMWVDYDYYLRHVHYVRLLGYVRFDPRIDRDFMEENVITYCTCEAADDFWMQYLELKKSPALVVGINTQPRCNTDWSDDDDTSEDEDETADSFSDESDDMEEDDDDPDYYEDGSFEMEEDPYGGWDAPDDYDRDGFIYRLFFGW